MSHTGKAGRLQATTPLTTIAYGNGATSTPTVDAVPLAPHALAQACLSGAAIAFAQPATLRDMPSTLEQIGAPGNHLLGSRWLGGLLGAATRM